MRVNAKVSQLEHGRWFCYLLIWLMRRYSGKKISDVNNHNDQMQPTNHCLTNLPDKLAAPSC